MNDYLIGPIKEVWTRNSGVIEVGSEVHGRTVSSMRLVINTDRSWSVQLFAEDPVSHVIMTLMPFSTTQHIIFDVPVVSIDDDTAG